MISYMELNVGIGYTGGKIIAIGRWGLSQRVFNAYPASNQNNWNKLALKAEFN